MNPTSRATWLTCVTLILSLNTFAQKSRGFFDANEPDWVSQRPVSSEFFIGIGRAVKSNKDYYQVAKKSALEDLVSNIEVTVSSNSFLHRYENNTTFSSEYKEIIQTHASAQINDFEMVDSWDNKEEFWIYYRLSKVSYKENRQKNKEAATTFATDFFKKARELQDHQVTQALGYYFQAFARMEEFLNEPITIIEDGKEVLLVNEIYFSIKDCFNRLELSSVSGPSIDYEVFTDDGKKQIPIMVKFNSQPIRNMELIADLEENTAGENLMAISNQDGIANFLLGNVESKKVSPSLRFTVSISEKNFISPEDAITAKVFQEIPKPQCVVQISLKAMNRTDNETLRRNFNYLYNEGVKKYEAGNFSGARSDIENALQITQTTMAYMWLAKIAIKQNDQEGVIGNCTKAIQSGATMATFTTEYNSEFVSLMKEPYFSEFLIKAFGKYTYTAEALPVYMRTVQQPITVEGPNVRSRGSSFDISINEQSELLRSSSLRLETTPGIRSAKNKRSTYDNGINETFRFEVSPNAPLGRGSVTYKIKSSDFKSGVGRFICVFWRCTLKYPLAIVIGLPVDIPLMVLYVLLGMPDNWPSVINAIGGNRRVLKRVKMDQTYNIQVIN